MSKFSTFESQKDHYKNLVCCLHNTGGLGLMPPLLCRVEQPGSGVELIAQQQRLHPLHLIKRFVSQSKTSLGFNQLKLFYTFTEMIKIESVEFWVSDCEVLHFV